MTEYQPIPAVPLFFAYPMKVVPHVSKGDRFKSMENGIEIQSIPVSLVGGFNPFEKYSSNWVHLPQNGVRIKIFETTTQIPVLLCFILNAQDYISLFSELLNFGVRNFWKSQIRMICKDFHQSVGGSFNDLRIWFTNCIVSCLSYDTVIRLCFKP